MGNLKQVLKKILIGLLCIIMPTFLVGCKEDDTPLSFNDLSIFLKEFEVAVQPFLSNLEYNSTLTEEDKAILSSISDSLTRTSYEMGESFKSFNAVLDELENNQNDTTCVEKTSSSIAIKSGTTTFTSKLNTDKNNMSVICKNGDNEYIYELIKREDGGYFSQIATKNNDKKTYQIYQLSFVNNKGKLSVGFSEERYVSIYESNINESSFPLNLEKTFQNI